MITDWNRKPRILIVDDHETNIDVLTEIFAEEHEVRSARDGQEGLDLAREFVPDLVFLDVMMPALNGYEVCRRIRDEPRLRLTKIMMVSARAMVSDRLEGYEAGADDYVTKPFSEDEILSKARVYLRLKAVEEVDTFRDEILSLLSNDTRTPLRSIGEITQSLLCEDSNGEARCRIGRLLEQTTERLHAFFDGALELSALRAGLRPTVAERVDLRDVVQRATVAVQRAWKHGDDSLGRTVEHSFESSPSSRLDAGLVVRALTDLFDLCLRQIDPEQHVLVRVYSEPATAVIAVEAPFKAAVPERITDAFRPFAAVVEDENVYEAEPRLGLSLSFLETVVCQHGGAVHVELANDSTTRFCLRLPVEIAGLV